MKTLFIFLSLFLLFSSSIYGTDIVKKENQLNDTSLHILAGGAACFFTASIPALFIDNEHRSINGLKVISIGLTSSIFSGIFKELIDKRGYGTAEIRDTLNTISGGMIASIAIFYTYSIIDKNRSNKAGKFITLTGMGTVFLIPVIQNIIKKRKR